MLPHSLLLLSTALSTAPLLALAQQPEWPYNLPKSAKYFPEHESDARKHAAIQKRMEQESPKAVRKMRPDEGQMFFLDYWGFSGNDQSEYGFSNISSSQTGFQPPLLPVWDNIPSAAQLSPRFAPRQPAKRDFQCPSGTTSCSNIGRSDACCDNGLTCNLITDTGLGDVGCCQGNSCSGQISECQSGYTSCEKLGGGCCIPGYACASGGCVLIATETILVTPTVQTTSTPPPPQPTTSTPSSITSAPTSSTSTVSQCSSGFNSCPASLGGGCCATDMVCGPSTSCLPSSTPASTAVIPPNRPTSIATTTQALTSASATPSSCPTGFYQCSAYYNSGACCQVGRDCAMTSCPPLNPSSALVSNGITVLAGAGNGAATGAMGACATGWYGCAANLGGDCCPSGFNCGTASCWLNATAGAAETGSKAKEKALGARNSVPGAMMAGVMAMLTMLITIGL